MKKEKWNPEDWQGRSQKQVEGYNTIVVYTMIVLFVAILGTTIYNILTHI
jgi:hypothetical protein